MCAEGYMMSLRGGKASRRCDVVRCCVGVCVVEGEGGEG
jgi:hypothetical protein